MAAVRCRTQLQSCAPSKREYKGPLPWNHPPVPQPVRKTARKIRTGGTDTPGGETKRSTIPPTQVTPELTTRDARGLRIESHLARIADNSDETLKQLITLNDRMSMLIMSMTTQEEVMHILDQRLTDINSNVRSGGMGGGSNTGAMTKATMRATKPGNLRLAHFGYTTSPGLSLMCDLCGSGLRVGVGTGAGAGAAGRWRRKKAGCYRRCSLGRGLGFRGGHGGAQREATVQRRATPNRRRRCQPRPCTPRNGRRWCCQGAGRNIL